MQALFLSLVEIFYRVYFSFFSYYSCLYIYLYTHIFVAVSIWKDFLFYIETRKYTKFTYIHLIYQKILIFFSTHFFSCSTTMKDFFFLYIFSCFSLFSFQWKSATQKKKDPNGKSYFSFGFSSSFFVATWQLGYRKYKGGAIW